MHIGLASTERLEVIPGMHMGPPPGRRLARHLAAIGVAFAMALGPDIPSRWPASVETFTCPLDGRGIPPVDALGALCYQVADLIRSGAVVYVHCRLQSVSAPLITAAVLMHLGWTRASAERHVISRRGLAALSDEALSALDVLEAGLIKHPAPAAPALA